jgi:predicted phosphodiesterase
MKRLLIADVHANLPAFEAVLREAGSVDEIVFLGDVVGYGPHPAECVDLLQQSGARAILGNHDVEILSDPALGPPGEGAHSIWRHWSYRKLTSSQRRYLASLPDRISIASDGQKIEVIHNTPSKQYLHPAMPDELLAEPFRDVPGKIIYFAHSHRWIDRVVHGRRLVCFRAVGQPRDGDPRAGYAIERAGILEHKAVAYDVECVVRDLSKIGLPEPFLVRWVQFLRTGFDPEWSREYP